MKNSVGRMLVIGIILLLVVAILGPCLSTGPPAVDPRIIGQQIKLVNETMDVLQEEVAAAQAPSRWPFILFLISILLPLAAGMWLIWRSEESAIGHDHVMRTMIRAGFKESMIGAYLDDSSHSLDLPSVNRRALPRMNGRGRRQFRHRRRWRRRNDDEP